LALAPASDRARQDVGPDDPLLDGPSLGLAPLLYSELYRTLARIKEAGVGIFLVEQNSHR